MRSVADGGASGIDAVGIEHAILYRLAAILQGIMACKTSRLAPSLIDAVNRVGGCNDSVGNVNAHATLSLVAVRLEDEVDLF